MDYQKLYDYAPGAISNILPLDKDLAVELVNYALSLPTEYEIEDHFLNFLGPSDETFAFITNFKELKHEAENKAKQEAEKAAKKAEKEKQDAKNRPPIPSSSSKQRPKSAWGKEEEQKRPPSNKGRLKNNNSSVTTSELATKKPSNTLNAAQTKKLKKKNLDNLKDIESVLNDLETEKAANIDLQGASQVRRKCNCMATRHPLFEVAPNCLNCGKIICSKEGLQPCSFCGNELLSQHEKLEIINILKSEKGLIEDKQAHPTDKSIQNQQAHTTPPQSKSSKKPIKVSMAAGQNLWKAQEEAFKQAEEEKKRLNKLKEEETERKKEIEEQNKELDHYEKTKNINPELLEAQQRLETLLQFQDTGAERTRVIDNASDFEMPHISSGSMWLSPVERALQLKKSQKHQRKLEEQKKQSTGRTKKVVEMVIKDGKVKMVEKYVESEEGPADEEIEELQSALKEERLNEDADAVKQSWDFEEDTNRWSKPVYKPLKEQEDSAHHAEQKKQEILRSRVQFADADSNELVAAMPG